MHFWPVLFFPLFSLYSPVIDARDGKEIVEKLNKYRNKCKEPDGGSWVPLPDGVNCGNAPCEFPKEWCVIKSKDGVPDLFCESLDSTCQEAVIGGVGGKEEAKLITSAENSAEEASSEETETTQKTTATTTTATTATPQEPTGLRNAFPCDDFHEVCCFWAASGECDRNPTWMKRACRRSCGVCDCGALDIETCPTRVTVENCRWLVPFPISPAVAPIVGVPRTRILITQPEIPPARQPTPGISRPPGFPNQLSSGIPRQLPLPAFPNRPLRGGPNPPGVPRQLPPILPNEPLRPEQVQATPRESPPDVPSRPQSVVPPAPSRPVLSGVSGLPEGPNQPPSNIAGVPRQPTRANSECQDHQPLCRFWATSGQCGLNTVFMAVNCPASCGFC